MGCGASAEARAAEPLPLATQDKASCKQLEELGITCDHLADALQSNATDGVLQDHYSVAQTSIGSGNFSTVRMATCKRTGQKYAVKTINLKWASRDSMKRARRRSSGECSMGLESSTPDGRKNSVGGEGGDATLLTMRDGSGGTSEMKTKQLRRVYSNTALELRQIVREIEVLQGMKHDSIVEMREYFISPNSTSIHIVLELLPGGDIVDALHDRPCFTEDEARTVARRVLLGLEYLHAHGCVHRDLKFENLLLKVENDLSTVKIVDFGFARRFLGVAHNASSTAGFLRAESMGIPTDLEDPKSPVSAAAKATFCGTPHYMAPEVIGLAEGPTHLKSDTGYQSAADMWAFGVVLSRMLTGVVPFDADTQKDLYALIKRGQVDMSGWEWDEVSEEAKQLIRRLLSTDMKKRPTASEAIRHPWLTKGTPNERTVTLPSQPSVAAAMAASAASAAGAGSSPRGAAAAAHAAAPAARSSPTAAGKSPSRLEAALLRLHREGRLEGAATRSDDASVALIQQLLALGVLISEIPPREALEEMVGRARVGRTSGMLRADTAMAPRHQSSSDKSGDMPRVDTAFSEAMRKSAEVARGEAPPAEVVAAATKAAEEKAVTSFINWAGRRESSSPPPEQQAAGAAART